MFHTADAESSLAVSGRAKAVLDYANRVWEMPE